MARENPGKLISYNAAGNLSAFQFTFVELGASGLATPGASGDPVIGVLQDKPDAAGRPGAVMIDGETKMKMGYGASVGDQVMVELNTGLALLAAGIGNHAVGMVTVGASDTETGTVLLYGANVQLN